jgi:hypothetical protein
MSQNLHTGYQRPGYTSAITVGDAGTTSTLAYAKFNVTQKGESLDTTNFTSYYLNTIIPGTGVNIVSAAGKSFSEGIIGVMESTYTAGGNWDANLTPFLDPPGLYPRNDLLSLRLWISTIDGTSWFFPWARVFSGSVGTTTRGIVTFDWEGANQGPYQQPNQSNVA